MKVTLRFEWSEDKNQQMQLERGLSFEQIQTAIEQGKLIDIIPHLKEEFKHQQLLVIDIEGYNVLVPYVEDEKKVFLKTAFESCKATKDYMRG